MNIDPKKITFSDLTEGSNSSLELKVPDYQRTYVWKKGEQISEFWQDLSDQFEDKLSNENSSTLFLGNLILCDNYIVDGQQRITTYFYTSTCFSIMDKETKKRN